MGGWHGGGFKYCWGPDSIGINSCYYYNNYYYLNHQYVISVATVCHTAVRHRCVGHMRIQTIHVHT